MGLGLFKNMQKNYAYDFRLVKPNSQSIEKDRTSLFFSANSWTSKLDFHKNLIFINLDR